MEVSGYLAALLMGLLLGLVGGGGSILTVPILVYLFGQDPLVATTGSLFVVGVAAVLGAGAYARRGWWDLKTGMWFALPSFAGVYAARGLLLPALPETLVTVGDHHLTKSALVLTLFAIVMVLASLSMIRPEGKPAPRGTGRTPVLVYGFFVGGVTGLVGAGGGFLIVPALAGLLGLPMRVAVGTSLGIIAVNSLFGFAVSAPLHPLQWGPLVGVSAAGILGLLAGQQLSPRVNEEGLRRGLGYFTLLAGLLILLTL